MLLVHLIPTIEVGPEGNGGAEGGLETTSCEEKLAEVGMLAWRREDFQGT